MSFRSLALGAATGVLLVSLLHIFLFPTLGTDARFWYAAVIRTLLLTMVALAAALAASRFGWWSEYAGRAWTLFFVEYSVLTVSEILRRWAPNAHLASEICVIVANVAGIGAYLLMARWLHAAGLDYYGSKAKRAIFIALALVLAVALCHAPILDGWHSLRSDQPNPGSLVSPLADVITFVLVAPLLLTTFALRGGQIFWMFAFLTTGTIGWMVNQGAATILRLLGGGDDAIRAGRMTGFAMACFFITAAAITQWLAAQRALKGADAHA
jgi:hypothetical protein